MNKKTYHVYKGHSLEDYHKKYGNKNYQVVKKEDADKDNSLLNNKSWWLIDDIYYETPTSKCPPISWWRNVNVVGKIVTCVIGAGVIATAVAVPVAMSMNQVIERTIEVQNGSLKTTKPILKDNGDMVFDLTCADDTKEVAYITKITVGGIKLNYSEFVFDKQNHTLTILNKALTKANPDAKIVIIVVEKVKTPEVITVAAIRIKATTSTIPVLHPNDTLQFVSVVKPSNAANPNVDWKLKFRTGEEGIAEISDTGLLTAKASGVVTVYATPKDDPTGSRKVVSNEIQVTIKVDVTEVSLDKHEMKLVVGGEPQNITATIAPTGATDPNINWYVDGEEGIVSLGKETTASGEENTITAVNSGTITLCAYANDNPNVYDVCTVNVELPDSMINWTKKVKFDDETEASPYELAKTADRIYFDRLGPQYESPINANETVKEAQIGETESDVIIARFISEPGVIGGNQLYILSNSKIVFEDDDLVEKDDGPAGLFYNCSSAQSISFNNIDTSKMTKMHSMFENCHMLNELDLSKLDTSNVENMSNMFAGLFALESLDVTPLETSKVTDMSNMFAGSLFSKIKLGEFNTSNVKNMGGMFSNCKNLTTLDLTSFDTSNVTLMTDMFSCDSMNSQLKTIYASEKFVVKNKEKSMFENLENLVGGEGTVWSNEHIDSEYARIDQGASAPGYFTLKLEPTLDKLYFEIDEETGLVSVSMIADYIEGAVVIPDYVEIDGQELPVRIVNDFRGCTEITSVVLPDTIETIRTRAFASCSNLETINIPQSITNIEHGAFVRNLKLKFKVDSGNSNYASALNDTCLVSKDGTQLFAYPSAQGEADLSPLSTLTVIKEDALADSDINSIALPDSLQQIEYRGFYGSNLSSIKIPENVTNIGDEAFLYCSNLKTVYIDSQTIADDEYGFSNLLMDYNIEVFNRVIYVKTGITPKEGSLLANTQLFSKEGTEGGYDKYVCIYQPE